MTLPADWRARVGDVWADEWRRTDRSFAGLAPALDAAIVAVAPAAGRAVDLGSGAGATSLALAAARRGLSITGIDLSPALVAVARERAAGVANLRFAVGSVPDALAALAPVDLVFSRHGVMFFDDPAAAFRGIRAAMKPGAALVFSCFRSMAENRWASELVAALDGVAEEPAGYVPGPFAFADPGFVEGLLTSAGFDQVTTRAADYRYLAGAGGDPVEDATAFFGRIGPASRLLAQAPAERRPMLRAHVKAVVGGHLHDAVVDFPAAAWLVSARATKENA